MNRPTRTSLSRRNLLTGLGAGGAGALLRPLLAQAQSPGVAAQRLLLIHRPCGTEMSKWWPTGGETDWVSSPLLSSFDKLRNDMVVIKGVDCPRRQEWLGDKHGAGMIAMMAPPPADKGSDLHVWPVLPGYTVAQQNNTNAKFFTAPDKTIDQLLLEKIPGLQGALIPSVQLTASSESADSRRDCCLRVVSYAKPDPAAPFPTPLWPENRPQVAFMNSFGRALVGIDPAKVARIQAQNRSVLDYIRGGLTGLKARLPASQLPKIDAHATAIRDLEKQLDRAGAAAAAGCTPPSLDPLPAAIPGISQNDAQHHAASVQQLQLIKTLFQCDLTRVVSFTYGYGNSGIRFSNVLQVAGLTDKYRDTAGGVIRDSEGHHNISHNGGTGFKEAQYIIDKVYCDLTAQLLEQMKATPDSLGPGSLLDNTLVVFWNECSNGNPHSTIDMPILAFGGKFLRLQVGRYLQLGSRARTMADVWVQTAQAWGYRELTQYGDAMWNRGGIPALFG